MSIRTKFLLYQIATIICFSLIWVALGNQRSLAQKSEPTDRSEGLPHTPPATAVTTPASLPADSPSSIAAQASSAARILVGDRRVYLPLVYLPPRLWQQIGADTRDINAIALVGQRLYLADRTDDLTGGIYYLDHCDGTTLTKSDLSKAKTVDVAINEHRGVAIAFDATTFFSTNSGNNWSPASGNLEPGAYAITFGQDGLAYAGTDGGVYQSTNQGEHWAHFSQDAPSLLLVNELWYDDAGNALWVGTNQTGAWRWRNTSEGFKQLVDGLDTDRARDVWSIHSTTIDSTVYTFIGTSNGVYLRTGNDDQTPWSVVGGSSSALDGRRVYSLAMDDEGILYAGASGAGVWQIPISSIAQSGNWQRVEGGSAWSATVTVRDLIWDPEVCRGLIAATVDGVWVFR
jgi:photosystem II stability/assembly factor-like uncharacterized protein